MACRGTAHAACAQHGFRWGAAACRVHTLAMAVVDDAASLFRAADGAATLALLAKLTVEAAQQCKMEEARNKLQVRCNG